MKDLAVREAELTPAQQTLSMIANAAADPTCDVGKMEALNRLYKETVADEARKAYNAAMIECQAAMSPVVKNCVNNETHSKYVNLEAIDQEIKPIYQHYGFGITVHNPQMEGEKLVVSATVLHRAGHAEQYSVIFANDSKGPKGGPVKTEIQGAVATISYATRVLKCKIFDITIVNSDKDGQQGPQFITQSEADNLRDLIEQAAGSPERAVQVTATILRLTGAKTLEGISKQLYRTAIESAKMVGEKRRAKG